MTAIAVDVLFFSQVSNPDACPSDWPATCVEVVELASPVAPGATRMTLAEYAAYRAERQASFDAWLDAKPPHPADVADDRDTALMLSLRDKPRDQWSSDDVTAAVQILVQRGQF